MMVSNAVKSFWTPMLDLCKWLSGALAPVLASTNPVVRTVLSEAKNLAATARIDCVVAEIAVLIGHASLMWLYGQVKQPATQLAMGLGLGSCEIELAGKVFLFGHRGAITLLCCFVLCIGDALGAATLLLDAAIHSIAKV